MILIDAEFRQAVGGWSVHDPDLLVLSFF